MKKAKVAIIGPGNIGTDLLYKIKRNPYLELVMVVGIKESQGTEIARQEGIDVTTNGIDDLLKRDDVDIVFDSTGAGPHLKHAPLLKEKGIFALDLTPAAVGPYVVPAVNLDDDLLTHENLNMVTCGGQATVPIAAAINAVADVSYAEVISSVSSKSAGPGTRQNIDEFTETTKHALEKVAGADKAKVIIVLNPAEPPIYMRNTIYTKVKNPDIDLITKSVEAMVEKLKKYVPGYTLLMAPIIKDDIVTTMIQVEGLGDFLPVYAGNLDIINAAAIEVAEHYAVKKLGVK
ncbi:acetaldehyde dehydrogenase (acetylating) [Fusibacter paucivorans]|uniref:Acetaldehyde dehydrogenase n=1 Tax=Fusibacter paucivorans TaxID=76009 RepID=A0ABS5PK96_9FIRM|nr:acetaldehyde dehydrogenase (acetylating) [Fusibacter paucivorans]MBS7525539.1 acetaldehyde dehydrogenase (acetylating) [Fusibacter paucivorans]